MVTTPASLQYLVGMDKMHVLILVRKCGCAPLTSCPDAPCVADLSALCRFDVFSDRCLCSVCYGALKRIARRRPAPIGLNVTP